MNPSFGAERPASNFGGGIRVCEYGYALFFRRHESPFPSFEARLRALEPEARYRVVRRVGYDVDSEETMSGEDLANLVVGIDEQPGTLLIEYTKQ